LDPYCIVCIDFGAASDSIRFMCHIFINNSKFSWKHEGDCEDGTFEGDSDLGMGLPRKRIGSGTRVPRLLLIKAHKNVNL